MLCRLRLEQAQDGGAPEARNVIVRWPFVLRRVGASVGQASFGAEGN